MLSQSKAIENIDHSKTKTQSPQTNGVCERFHRTIQDEYHSIAFRKSVPDLGRISGQQAGLRLNPVQRALAATSKPLIITPSMELKEA